jgi:hypothetical protein
MYPINFIKPTSENSLELIDELKVCSPYINSFHFLRTYKNFINKELCIKLIEMAEEYCKTNGGWKTSRHTSYNTTDLQLLSNDNFMNILKPLFENKLQKIIWNDYGIKLQGFNDLFFVKYSSEKNTQSSLNIHRDESILSFVITLNDNFTNGGTIIKSLDKSLVHQIGSISIHCGKIRHGASPITSGTRYVIIGFLSVTHGPLYKVNTRLGDVYNVLHPDYNFTERANFLPKNALHDCNKNRCYDLTISDNFLLKNCLICPINYSDNFFLKINSFILENNIYLNNGAKMFSNEHYIYSLFIWSEQAYRFSSETMNVNIATICQKCNLQEWVLLYLKRAIKDDYNPENFLNIYEHYKKNLFYRNSLITYTNIYEQYLEKSEIILNGKDLYTKDFIESILYAYESLRLNSRRDGYKMLLRIIDKIYDTKNNEIKKDFLEEWQNYFIYCSNI